MSKITQALEKAARDRARERAAQPTVTPKPTLLALEPSSVAAGLPAGIPVGGIEIDPHIVSATDPQSPIAEQYRILRTNLQSLKGFAGAKALVVTSAVHGEGKSVTSINLALTLAQQEHLRVLLIDADLRCSSVDRWLGLGSTKGLSTVLSDGLNLDGAILKLQSPPLSVLPAGPHPERPAELLESSNMRRLLAMLRSQYDVIIIDAPPVLPVTDPGILGAMADGTLLVVRAGRTQRKVVRQAQELLRQTKAKLMGCVLTHVEYYIPGYARYYKYRYGEKSLAADKNGASEKNGNGHEPIVPSAGPEVSA